MTKWFMSEDAYDYYGIEVNNLSLWKRALVRFLDTVEDTCFNLRRKFNLPI